MKSNDKTNAVRLLAQKKIQFSTHTYPSETALSGTEVADYLSQPYEKVFKTLVTVGKSGAHYVFVVPVDKELDLKKAACHVGEKNVEMVKSKELLPLTGYVHGGCSPIGMKKFFRTTIDESASEEQTIIFSGGAIGLQIETSLSELAKAITFELANLTV